MVGCGYAVVEGRGRSQRQKTQRLRQLEMRMSDTGRRRVGANCGEYKVGMKSKSVRDYAESQEVHGVREDGGRSEDEIV